MLSFEKFVFIGVAGLTGVLVRYLCDVWVARQQLPPLSSTLGLNIVGCLIAGFVFAISIERSLITTEAGTVLLVGFCGGLTTFSAFGLQIYSLITAGQLTLAVIYTSFSPVLGVAAVAAGVKLGRSLFAA